MAYRILCGVCNDRNVYSLVVYEDRNFMNGRLEGIQIELEMFGRIINPPKTIN